MKIRQVKPLDKERVIELLREYDKYENALDKRHKIDSRKITSPYFDKLMECKTAAGFVLEVDGKVEGFIAGEDKKNMFGKSCTIHQFILSEKVRGKGYGKKLLKAHEDYFRKRGCSKVQAFVFVGNKGVLDFYKKQKYTCEEEGFMIRKKLK